MKYVVNAAIAATMLAASSSASFALEKVVMGTNWLAQGGHGGFYQAIADGTYEKYGLDVTVSMGGPQMNNRPMLAAGRLDFLLADTLLLSFDNVRNNIPTTVVAAFYQKGPQGLIAHAGEYKDFADLTKAQTVLMSKDGQFSSWRWMVKEHGFQEEQLRPYGYNLAQFLNDKSVVQQAYVTAEPIYAEAAGAKVDTYLFADYGFSTYGGILEARTDMMEKNPDLVQRFVDASIEGWYNFLYGDRTAAYKLILEANPDMTVEKLDKEMKQFEKFAIIDAGEAKEKGIGAVDLQRVKEFHALAERSGIIDAGTVDVTKVATDKFVNKGTGIDIRDKLQATRQ